MSSQIKLRLDWATYPAAKYACEHWHYSKSMPAGPTIKIGVWEDESFIGVIIYSLGAGQMTRGEKYGLRSRHDIIELSRVALKAHVSSVSRMISISLKMLKTLCPKAQMIISFADEFGQNHLGAIYQASNFIYSGVFEGDGLYEVFGKKIHPRSTHAKGWKQSLSWIRSNIDPDAKRLHTKKHRYLYPLNDELRKKIKLLSKPYPKRAGSIDGDAPTVQAGEGGPSPTPALQNGD